MSQHESLSKSTDSRVARIGVCIFLVAVTWLVFGQSLWHGFINYDDPVYVYENPVVRSGLTLHGIGWAFTHSHGGNWHPLTSISHMVDCQLYGLKPGGHHFTNVLLHTVAVLLLFVLLWQMTGALWRSAFVAAVFAIHPLHVESVAWVAERKDVLSGVFFMLTLLAYVRYTRGPSLWRYATILVLFWCGLMAKPMLVTVPFVLLLLDYWPLGRFPSSAPNWPRIGQLILEKIPLLVLSIASCIATLLAQEKALGSIKHFPLALRAGNALVSCLTYIREMIWPVGLTPFYPYPGNGVLAWEVILAIAVLLIITGTVFVFRKTRPYLITGWFWYLGMLVPVIGVIQVGLQGHADRYTYLPQIGLYLLIAWAMVDLVRSWRYQQQILFTGVITTIAVLAWCAWNQTSYWHDSETLWTHALALNSSNDVAQNNLGNAILQKGRIDEAILHYQKALELRPDYLEAHNNLGDAFLKEGRTDEAISHLQRALELQSNDADVHNNLGNALRQKGLLDEAISHFQKALELRSDHDSTTTSSAETHYNLGNALFQKGEINEAIIQYRKALEIQPENADMHNNLGTALSGKGLTGEAIAHYQKALEINPRSALFQNNLAWQLATCSQTSFRNGAKAIELANQASQLSGGKNLMILHTLAAAYAENGQFSQAVETAQGTLKLAVIEGNTALAEALRQEIGLYQTGKPYHETQR